MPKSVNLDGMTVELAPDVHLPTKRHKRPGCVLLDTADRLTALLGEPAKRIYLEMVQRYEEETHSPEKVAEMVYYQTYVYKAQLMWWKSSQEIPGPGTAPYPAAYQESVNTKVFIEERRQEGLVLFAELGRDLNKYKEQIKRYLLLAKVTPEFGFKPVSIFERIAKEVLPKLRRLRVLEFYLSYENILAVEDLINVYMSDILQQKYYL